MPKLFQSFLCPRPYGQRYHQRQADSTERRKPIVGVNVGRGETRWDPGEAMNAGPWGAVGGAEAEKIKRRGGYQWRPAPGSTLATLVKGWDVTNI